MRETLTGPRESITTDPRPDRSPRIGDSSNPVGGAEIPVPSGDPIADVGGAGIRPPYDEFTTFAEGDEPNETSDQRAQRGLSYLDERRLMALAAKDVYGALAKDVAAEYGVSGPTITRDKDYAKRVLLNFEAHTAEPLTTDELADGNKIEPGITPLYKEIFHQKLTLEQIARVMHGDEATLTPGLFDEVRREVMETIRRAPEKFTDLDELPPAVLDIQNVFSVAFAAVPGETREQHDARLHRSPLLTLIPSDKQYDAEVILDSVREQRAKLEDYEE